MKIQITNPQQNKFFGSIDEVTHTSISGWVINPDKTNEPVIVIAWQNNQVLAIQLANRERIDLKKAGYGNGKYGFVIPLPQLQDNSPISITVTTPQGQVFPDLDTSWVLEKSPIKLAIISSPRSGNTWMRHLLKTAYDLEELAAHTPQELFSQEFPERLVAQIHWLPEKNFCHTLSMQGIKVITIARHPLDTLLSILHFIQHEPKVARWMDGAGKIDFSLAGKSPTSSEFLNYAIGNGAKALLDVTRQWWQLPETLCIRYEDMVINPHETLSQLFQSIEQYPILPIYKILELNTLARFQATPNHHGWQGRPGLWRELIPASTAMAIYEAHPDLFKTLGYVCDPDWNLSEVEATARWKEICVRPLGKTEEVK